MKKGAKPRLRVMIDENGGAGQAGFSLIELVLAVLIMGIALVPILESLGSTFDPAASGEAQVLLTNAARGKMEEVLAMPYTDVLVSGAVTPSPLLSDAVSILGQTVTRNVYVVLYDGDGDGDGTPEVSGLPDPDLKKITVQVGNLRIQTLKSNE